MTKEQFIEEAQLILQTLDCRLKRDFVYSDVVTAPGARNATVWISRDLVLEPGNDFSVDRVFAERLVDDLVPLIPESVNHCFRMYLPSGVDYATNQVSVSGLGLRRVRTWDPVRGCMIDRIDILLGV